MALHGENTFTLAQKDIEHCDELAEEYLDTIKRREILEEYRSVQYVEEHSGDILLVCADGTMLYTPGELGRRTNIAGFKNGLRSDPEALRNLSTARAWELALA